MTAKADDAELLAAWAAGDRRAGAALLRRHVNALHRFFRNKVCDEAKIEDLVQQTLMACVEARARFRGDASFRTFLFAIARNTFLRFIRDHRVHESLSTDEGSVADLGLGVLSVLDLRREQQLLLTALRHIRVDSQIVLELYYWEKLTAKQIAEIIDTSESGVRGHLRRAKAELRVALERLARDPGELASTVDGLEGWAASIRHQWA